MASEHGMPADLPHLPAGWAWGALGSLVQPNRSICYGIVQPGNAAAGGVPILRASDVDDGRVVATGNLRVAPEIAYRYRRSELRGGEILITLVGAYFGKVAVAPPSVAGFNTARAVGIVPVDGDSAFTSWALRSPVVRRYMYLWATTTAQPTLNLGDVARLPIPLPPLPEQRRIAAVLGALDDKIELNRKMNRTLEQMAQAIFKSWFIDFDGHDPADMVESELGLIPRGWGIAPLTQQVDFAIGGQWGANPPDEKHTARIWCIRGTDLPALAVGDRGSPPERFVPPSGLERRRLLDGDLIFEVSGGSPTQSTGRVLLVTKAMLARFDSPLSCSNFCRLIRPQSPYQGHFLFHLLGFMYRRGDFFSLENGTTGIKNLPFESFSANHPLIHPPWDEVARFSASVAPLAAKLAANGAQSEALAALRDTLLPKLISGEIRVPDAEATIAAAT